MCYVATLVKSPTMRSDKVESCIAKKPEEEKKAYTSYKSTNAENTCILRMYISRFCSLQCARNDIKVLHKARACTIFCMLLQCVRCKRRFSTCQRAPPRAPAANLRFYATPNGRGAKF